MDGVTLGQVAEILAWIAGITGSFTVIFKVVSKAFNNALEGSLKPLNEKVEELGHKIEGLEKKHDNSDMGRAKDFLVGFLARIERGESVDEEELERFWENYDFYDAHGGNSYIHGKLEKMKEKGKL